MGVYAALDVSQELTAICVIDDGGVLLAEGKVAKEIATALDISLYTVDAHRGRIMKKLGLKSSTEIVRFAMRKGIVQ